MKKRPILFVEQWYAIRPLGTSKYMWKKYLHDFANGQQFWSSEDGNAGELVVLPSGDSIERLAREFPYLPVAGKTVKLGYVARVSVGSEFFDAPYGRRRGVVWQLSKERTAFPVHVVDPYAEASNNGPGPGAEPVSMGDRIPPWLADSEGGEA